MARKARKEPRPDATLGEQAESAIRRAKVWSRLTPKQRTALRKEIVSELVWTIQAANNVFRMIKA